MKSVRYPILTLAVCLVSVVLASNARAQTILFGVDGGARTDNHLNGANNTSYFGGMNLAAVIAGWAGKTAALVIPVAGEIRLSHKGYLDTNIFADVGLRLSNLTVGGGGAFSWDDSPEIPDAIAGGQTDSVIVLYPMSFGYSGFAKFNTGPEGRLFLQARYTMFPASMAFQYHSAEELQLASENNLPNQDVQALDNHTLRAAAGYFWGKNTIIRFQYTVESWRYERVFDNTTGAYDRDSKIYSLGLTWVY